MFVLKVITFVILATLGARIEGQDQRKGKKSDDLEAQASGKQLQNFSLT
jgi:hypothetical protein